MPRLLYALLLLATGLGGCSKGQEPMPAPLYLLDQSWQLVEQQGQPAGPDPVTLSLSSVDNLSAGQAPCNQYGGRFMLVAGTSYLTFSEQASTRATCAGQPPESRYLSLLPQVRRYVISHRQLQLFDAENPRPLLVFEVGSRD